MSFNLQAELIAHGTGYRLTTVKKWMRHIGARSMMDLQQRWRLATNAELMDRAAGELAAFSRVPEGADNG